MTIKRENLRLEHTDPREGFGTLYDLKQFCIINDKYERITVEEFINLTGMVLEELETKVEDLQAQINALKGV